VSGIPLLAKAGKPRRWRGESAAGAWTSFSRAENRASCRCGTRTCTPRRGHLISRSRRPLRPPSCLLGNRGFRHLWRTPSRRVSAGSVARRCPLNDPFACARLFPCAVARNAAADLTSPSIQGSPSSSYDLLPMFFKVQLGRECVGNAQTVGHPGARRRGRGTRPKRQGGWVARCMRPNWPCHRPRSQTRFQMIPYTPRSSWRPRSGSSGSA
jgi:hypothetical protein